MKKLFFGRFNELRVLRRRIKKALIEHPIESYPETTFYCQLHDVWMFPNACISRQRFLATNQKQIYDDKCFKCENKIKE